MLRTPALIPPDQMKPEYRLKRKAYRAPFQPNKNAMAETDDLMKKILHSKDQTMDEKWPEYERVLNKFLIFQNKAKLHRMDTLPPPPPPPTPTSSGKAPRRPKFPPRTQRQISHLHMRKGKGGSKLDRAMKIMQLLREGVEWDETHRLIMKP